MKKLEEYVRSIPDFPEPGIIFRDVTSILQDADGLQLAIDSIQEKLKDVDVDVIAGTESRGFIFGVPVAYSLGGSQYHFFYLVAYLTGQALENGGVLGVDG